HVSDVDDRGQDTPGSLRRVRDPPPRHPPAARPGAAVLLAEGRSGRVLREGEPSGEPADALVLPDDPRGVAPRGERRGREAAAVTPGALALAVLDAAASVLVDPPERAYVAHGSPAGDLCEELVVWVDSYQTAPRARPGGCVVPH